MHHFTLCVVNYLYLDGKPFARCLNNGLSGFVAEFVGESGHLKPPVFYRSYLSFCMSFDDIMSRLSLGVPFPVHSSDSPDVK